MTTHLEFPFVKTLKPRKGPRRTKLDRKRLKREAERQARKGKCTRQILHVVESVATLRQVPWVKLFSPDRESDAVSSARVVAMGLCCALGVPQYMVARAFSRNWATVFSAEKRCSKLYRAKPEFRKEWDGLAAKCALVNPDKNS